jgi:hypothetical protein
MAVTVSIMIVPSATADSVPQILMEHGGVWHDMSPTLASNAILTVSEIRQKIDEDLAELMDQVENGGHFGADSVPLVEMGQRYYKWIAPTQFQEVLRKTAEAAAGADAPLLRIHMHTQAEWIPWEIFHDGTDFLGLRFQIARLPIVPHALNNGDNQPRKINQVYNLLGRNVLDAPERNIWDTTFDGLIEPAKVNRFPVPGDDNATYPTVQQLKPSLDSDIFHVTCHGIKVKENQKEAYYWTLDHTTNITWTYHITSKILENMILSKRPLVFGNACGSNNAGGANIRGLIPTGFGATFFSRGALNFIGTFAPITKTIALDFARQFYQRLLGAAGQPGQTIGKAMWATKMHYRDISGDPSYLFYCLYGPPETSFER